MSAKCILESKQLCFRPLDKKYLDKYGRWLNDQEINQFLGPISGSVFTKEKVEEWYESMKNQADKRLFTIHLKEQLEAIGYCGLYRINHRHERATIQAIIGDEKHHHQGYGTETAKTLLDYGFTKLSLHTISLSFMETNEKAAGVPKRLGFQEVGRLRDYWKVGNTYRDRVIMDITRGEFYKTNREK